MANRLERTTVTLRLPKELLARIDEIRAAHPLAVPRNTWISEAVVQRVKEELACKENQNVSK